jgi:hypothetical protein
MPIGYRTIDEVNEDTARRLARACGVRLYPLWPRESPPDGGFDAVLYDWDCLPQSERQELLAELLASPRPRAVALHGYNLEDGQAEALRRHSVAVYRRLHPRVFRFLRRAVRAVRAGRALAHSPQTESYQVAVIPYHPARLLRPS